MKVSVIKGKRTPNLHGPVWKSDCPPINLMTGWATRSSNTCNQAFAITGKEPLIALWRNFGKHFFTPLYTVKLQVVNMLFSPCNLEKVIFLSLISDETSTKVNVQHQHVNLLWAWAGLSKTLNYLRRDRSQSDKSFKWQNLTHWFNKGLDSDPNDSCVHKYLSKSWLVFL